MCVFNLTSFEKYLLKGKKKTTVPLLTFAGLILQGFNKPGKGWLRILENKSSIKINLSLRRNVRKKILIIKVYQRHNS